MIRSATLIAFLFLFVFSCKQEKPRVLVFSKTKGYRHESIETGKQALIDLGQKNSFEVDTTEDASAFTEENLKRYRAVVFLNTTMDVLDPVQQGDFKRFIQAGGGFVGIHAAADTEYEWPWYGKLVGAYFKSHPEIQAASSQKVGEFVSGSFPAEWKRTDEWYNYKKISPDIHVVYKLNESTYKGGENGDNHPIVWYHEFDGGRSFYTGYGHTKESYAEPEFQSLLVEGIKYAIGEKSLDYDKVRSPRVPEDNRFSKTVLDFNLDEPTEMAILPDGRILFVERKGDVKLYKPETNKVTTVNHKDVWTKFEDGMIGLAADPEFRTHPYIYLFYSHPTRSANVLSRFEFKGDSIDFSSEKEILEVPTQRDKCCHTGGSLTFGKDRQLFISTGDNTSPFESDGYSPSDERPERGPFDAQKSSSNTNDLRGKILRIRVEKDGTYTIPEGNLFPKGEEKTRPEIYVMGTRNPYRISYDSKTGYLYWGEVGPDAGKDSVQGPRGYDEVNQARRAGFFGWPYFVGNNFAYAKYDFATKAIGPKWDPQKPINTSPNNTGKRELPPVSPAFIYYPYAKSEEFPMVKEGGRNAMAGPVYYSKEYNGSATAFPAYFDGKLMMYDWMRGWIFLVTMNDAGDMVDIEPFMADTKFNNIIDMAYGPDGRLYMLEYGTAWFKQNIDARLVRIDYNSGNRAPEAMLRADKYSGSVPLTVKFSAEGSHDYDGDQITYTLKTNNQTYESKDGNFTVTYETAGNYQAILSVSDGQKATATAGLAMVAGNEAPSINISVTKGNGSFFFANSPVVYQVEVTDKEDGSTTANQIKPADVIVRFDYLKGFDMTQIAQGHQVAEAELPGKALIDKSDCKSCHLIDQRSAGPAYQEVADKYRTREDAVDYLAAKIIKGGAGVWGTTEMAAHPQISVDDAKRMVEYILSLDPKIKSENLPLSGTVKPEGKPDGVYILSASYADKGLGKASSLARSASYVLRNPMLKADQAVSLHIARVMKYNDDVALENVLHNAHADFGKLDMTGVKKAVLYPFIYQGQSGGDIELRLDSPEGKLIGKATATKPGLTRLTVRLEPETGYHKLFAVFKNSQAGDNSLFYFGGVQLMNQ